MKHFKRAAAMLLAVVLSLCLAVTAFAEGTAVTTGSLTVTGTGLTGKKVTAVRMFTANANTNAETSKDNDFDSYTLEDAWLAFFKQEPRYTAVKAAGNITSENPSDQEVKDAVVAYVEGLRATEKDLAKLADDAQAYYRNNATAFSLLMRESEAATDVAGTPTATIANLQSGYYLVFPEMGSTGNVLPAGSEKRGTDAMLVNVPKNGGNTAAAIKSTYPTVEKKVKNSTDGEFKPNGTAQVGEKVTFQLTAEVPDMSDYTKYTFKFVDTMTKGLDFAGTDSVTVKIDDKVISKDASAYTATYTAESKTLTIGFDDLKTVNKEGSTPVATGDKIVVTYEAYINKDASHTDPATNKVHLEYSNNPDGSGKGESTPSESKVYTYEIKIDKFYKDNETNKPLAGATFTLTTSETDSTNGIDLINDDAAEGTTGLVYHVKGHDETGTSTKVVTTDATGKITIKGLKEGTYYLHETAAPTGFNKLTHPIKIEITADTSDLSQFTYKVNGKDNTKNDTTIKVENVKGVMLPETGSIGTIGLTALGVAVVLLGVFAPRKKKKENR